MILKFEKAINRNQEMRVKYPDDPSKYDAGMNEALTV